MNGYMNETLDFIAYRLHAESQAYVWKYEPSKIKGK